MSYWRPIKLGHYASLNQIYNSPSCQVIKALYMISERERITMNYPHGSLISFVTPLLFDACKVK